MSWFAMLWAQRELEKQEWCSSCQDEGRDIHKTRRKKSFRRRQKDERRDLAVLAVLDNPEIAATSEYLMWRRLNFATVTNYPALRRNLFGWRNLVGEISSSELRLVGLHEKSVVKMNLIYCRGQSRSFMGRKRQMTFLIWLVTQNR